MITIGRRYSGPRRNYAAPCDICGVVWHRHELQRDSEGMLVCPDDVGLNVKDINTLRAEGALEPSTVITRTRDLP
jgi:hypothetical protein